MEGVVKEENAKDPHKIKLSNNLKWHLIYVFKHQFSTVYINICITFIRLYLFSDIRVTKPASFSYSGLIHNTLGQTLILHQSYSTNKSAEITVIERKLSNSRQQIDRDHKTHIKSGVYYWCWSETVSFTFFSIFGVCH